MISNGTCSNQGTWLYNDKMIMIECNDNTDDVDDDNDNINNHLFVCLVYRGMVDASGDQFVAYFLPSKETLGKRKRDQESADDYVEDEE